MPAAMELEKESVTEKDESPSVDGKVARKKGASADDNREAFSPELLRLYYARLFPYDQVLVFPGACVWCLDIRHVSRPCPCVVVDCGLWRSSLVERIDPLAVRIMPMSLCHYSCLSMKHEGVFVEVVILQYPTTVDNATSFIS